MEGIKDGLLQIQQQKCKPKRKPDSVSGKLKQKAKASGEVFPSRKLTFVFLCLSLTSWFQEGFASRRAEGWGHKLLWLHKEVVLSIKCALGQLLQFFTLLTCATSFSGEKLCIPHVTIIHVPCLTHFGVKFNVSKCTIPRLDLPHGSHKEKPRGSSSLSSLLSLHQSIWVICSPLTSLHPISLLCLQALHPDSCTAPSAFSFSARVAFPSHPITLHPPPLLPPFITVSTLLPPVSPDILCVCCIKHNLLHFSLKTYHGIAFFTFHFHSSVAFYNQFPTSFFKLSPPCSSMGWTWWS